MDISVDQLTSIETCLQIRTKHGFDSLYAKIRCGEIPLHEMTILARDLKFMTECELVEAFDTYFSIEDLKEKESFKEDIIKTLLVIFTTENFWKMNFENCVLTMNEDEYGEFDKISVDLLLESIEEDDDDKEYLGLKFSTDEEKLAVASLAFDLIAAAEQHQ